MHPALTTVLDRIVAREDHDRTALPPLYEAADPEAVASLLESSTDIVVRVDYGDYRATIGHDPHEVTVIDGDQ